VKTAQGATPHTGDCRHGEEAHPGAEGAPRPQGEGAGPGRGEVRRGDRLRGLRLLRAGGAHHQRGGAHLPQELPHPAQPPQVGLMQKQNIQRTGEDHGVQETYSLNADRKQTETHTRT